MATGALVLGCGGNGGPEPSGGPSVAGLADCSAPDTLRANTVQEFVDALTHSYRYTPLPLDAQNGILAATRAMDAGDLTGAAAAAARAGYGTRPLAVGSACYWLLTPPGFPGAIEQTVLFYAARWRRNLVIEAPHAQEDNHTDSEAALLFANLEAKALLISGSHRCIQFVATSACHPSAECSHVDPSTGLSPKVPPAESDPAHSVNNALYAMHLAFRGTDATVLQLHTNLHSDKNGDAMISNGTHYEIPGTVADAFYQALRVPELVVSSCNDPILPPLPGAFCGEINTQSLASNGAADTCTGTASSRGGPDAHRFIHLEQSHYRMCGPDELPSNPTCLESFDTWTARVDEALSTAIAPTR